MSFKLLDTEICKPRHLKIPHSHYTIRFTTVAGRPQKNRNITQFQIPWMVGVQSTLTLLRSFCFDHFVGTTVIEFSIWQDSKVQKILWHRNRPDQNPSSKEKTTQKTGKQVRKSSSYYLQWIEIWRYDSSHIMKMSFRRWWTTNSPTKKGTNLQWRRDHLALTLRRWHM